MCNRRLLDALYAHARVFCPGLRSMQRRGCRLLQLVEVVPAEGDLDGGPVGVPVVLDLEMERLEQATQDRLGQLAEASAGRRKCV
jgi:hypothetical protein